MSSWSVLAIKFMDLVKVLNQLILAETVSKSLLICLGIRQPQVPLHSGDFIVLVQSLKCMGLAQKGCGQGSVNVLPLDKVFVKFSLDGNPEAGAVIETGCPASE